MSILNEHVQGVREGIGRINEHVPGMPAAQITLARLVMMAGNLVATALERALRPAGLNEPEFRTLVMIFASPDGRAYPSELCQFATQKPTNMTRIIDALVRRGLVTRTPSAEDRRRIILQITDAGRALTHEVLPQLFPHVHRLFDGFSDAECRQFDALLQKLIHNLDATLPDQDLQP
jgi:MarR family transcriptional regulator, negative regulator of the multidrug operon emrRAB